MSESMTPVFLMECGTLAEAESVKGLLQQNGIEVVIQAGGATSMMPHLQQIIPPRLLVLERDFEKAKTLLGSEQVKETTGPGWEGGICAVHEQDAVALCTRCGSFLCAMCGSLGDPPVCESCLEQENLPERPQGSQWPMIGLAALVLLGALAAYLARLRS